MSAKIQTNFLTPTVHLRQLCFTLLLGFFMAAFTACGGGSPTGSNPGGNNGSGKGSSIIVVVSPASVTFDALGDSKQLTVTVKDGNGNPISGATVSWSISDQSVATVSGSGKVTAKANGTATITAEYKEASDQVTVTVDQKITSIKITPRKKTLPINGDLQLQATARDANGYAVKGAAMTWSSSNASVASVSSSGVVVARSKGTATITAQVTEPNGGQRYKDTADITVSGLSSIPVGPGGG